MNKHDIRRNLPRMTGRLGSCGYDRWWHTFTGFHKATGKKKLFFVEYCVVNPELGGKEPILGDKEFQRPAYLLVRAGAFGRNGFALKRYYGIEEMEAAGIISPVVSLSCKYRAMVRFADTVRISLRITAYNGIKLELAYQVRNAETDALCCTGESSHCFLGPEGKPVSLKKDYPQYHALFMNYLQEEEQ